MEEFDMDYFSEEYFRKYNLHNLNETRNFSDQDRNAPANAVFDIFLSYNIDDFDVVEGIYNKLAMQGYRVYLDNIVDPGLKYKKTDKQTAQIIHNRLLHSKSLIYAQSKNANQSNWMPWEIGVVDGQNRKCMIMFLSNSDSRIPAKREFLYLYPYLMRNDWNQICIDSDDLALSGQLLKDYL